MAKCPRCKWNGDFVEIPGITEVQCPNCGFQGNLDTQSYDTMSKDELLAICEERDLEVPARASKQDLIDLITGP